MAFRVSLALAPSWKQADVTMVLWLKGLALGFGAGTLTMGIASFVSYPGPSEGRAPEQPPDAVAAARAATGETAEQPGASTIARVQASVTEEALIPAPDFLDPPPSREALPAQPVDSRRAEELAAVRTVRAALLAKNPQAALAELDRYELTYPEASFGLPAKLLRIEALAVSGRFQTAQELASAFLAAHPDSPHAARLRAFVQGESLPE